MFAKLALRSVRRQLGNYLIYFITVALTVALMFAVNNVIFSERLAVFAESSQELRAGLIAVSVFAALVAAAVLSYAAGYMLSLRRREFGVYLTLGMTRKNILTVFTGETLLLGAAALAAGIALGLFLYQGLMALVSALMEQEAAFAAYSLRGLALTAALTAGMFLLSAGGSALYLRRASILELMQSGEKAARIPARPGLWLAGAGLGLGGVILGCVMCARGMEDMLLHGAEIGALLPWLALFALGMFAFHFCLCRGLTPALLKSPRFRAGGANTFVARELSARLGVNSVMAGLLALLFSAAVIGANISFTQRAGSAAELDRRCPFDVMGGVQTGLDAPLGPREAEAVIAGFADIERVIPYDIYTSGTGYLHGFTPWAGTEGLCDSFMRESDFDALMAALGREPAALEGGFLILANDAQTLEADFSAASLALGGREYACRGVTNLCPVLGYMYFIAVVPDEAAAGLAVEASYAAFDLADAPFDWQGLQSALRWNYDTGYGYFIELTSFDVREYVRADGNARSAVFIVGELFLSVIFVLLAMAMLSLKTLSGLSGDRRRYAVLSRLGLDRRGLRRALFTQTFAFFLLPFALPLLTGLPAALISGRIMSLSGYAGGVGEVRAAALLITLVCVTVYALYFTAAYLIAGKNVIPTGE